MAGDVTCARLVLEDKRPIYAKVIWEPSTFTLDVSDGFQAWTISPSPGNIEDRASQWDQSVSDYLRDVRTCLSEERPSSVYKLVNTEDNGARLSWSLERAGTKLECRWRLKNAADSKEINCQILDFVFASDSKIREELAKKKRTFDSMKGEVEKCLEQNKRLVEEKNKCEDELFKKFVLVLNSKKAKLRELEAALPARPLSRPSNEDEDLGEDTDQENEDAESNEESSGKRPTAPNSPETVTWREEEVVADSPEGEGNEAGTSSARPADEVSDMESMLLNSSTYTTSAPRKRRLI